MIELPPTRVAALTPPGTGAIATLALEGPRAWEVVRGLSRPRSEAAALPTGAQTGRFWLTRVGDELLDEVVVAVRRTEPWPRVEVHCHGGREVVRMLLEAFRKQGVEACGWPEFERAVATDPLQAEALQALTRARTQRTAAILLDQYHGAYHRALEAVATARRQGDDAGAERLLEELARREPLGRHLTEPWRVVVAGAPNVGKSSLVNALAGFGRCVVSPIPGTTRDLVTTVIAVEGWPIELVDTAGLREQASSLEGQGITLARNAAANADLCLWVLDASAPPAWPAPGGTNVRLVVNKIDLPPAWDLHLAPDAVGISALTSEGIGPLCEALARWLVPDPPPPGVAVPFTPALARPSETGG